MGWGMIFSYSCDILKFSFKNVVYKTSGRPPEQQENTAVRKSPQNQDQE